MSSFLFPDINVWLAASYERHIHYPIAQRWLEGLDDGAQVCFCRFTQIGFLRLLTTEVVMGADVLSQTEAWRVYDRWLEDDRILFLEEPPLLGAPFRALSQQERPAPKNWADSYLAAFAIVGGLQLVTFDQTLSAKSPDVILLSMTS